MTSDRRTFVNRLMATSIGAFALSLLAPVVTFLGPRTGTSLSSNVVTAADGETLDPEVLGEGESTHGLLGGQKVVVVRRQEDYLVLTATCTHLGCLVHFEEDAEHLACPCHGGRYDLQGQVTGGPPPRPLERIPVRREGDRLVRAD